MDGAGDEHVVERVRGEDGDGGVGSGHKRPRPAADPPPTSPKRFRHHGASTGAGTHPGADAASIWTAAWSAMATAASGMPAAALERVTRALAAVVGGGGGIHAPPSTSARLVDDAPPCAAPASGETVVYNGAVVPGGRKYWRNRGALWSRFREVQLEPPPARPPGAHELVEYFAGVVHMDGEGWYSVTPEVIANHITAVLVDAGTSTRCAANTGPRALWAVDALRLTSSTAAAHIAEPDGSDGRGVTSVAPSPPMPSRDCCSDPVDSTDGWRGFGHHHDLPPVASPFAPSLRSGVGRVAATTHSDAPGNLTVYDLFAGCGGNVAAFARHPLVCHVVAVELNRHRLQQAKHNVHHVYGIPPGKVTWIQGDCVTLLAAALRRCGRGGGAVGPCTCACHGVSRVAGCAPDLCCACSLPNPDVVFLAPPWGGEGYTRAPTGRSPASFDLRTRITLVSPSAHAVHAALCAWALAPSPPSAHSTASPPPAAAPMIDGVDLFRAAVQWVMAGHGQAPSRGGVVGYYLPRNVAIPACRQLAFGTAQQVEAAGGRVVACHLTSYSLDDKPLETCKLMVMGATCKG